MQPLLSFYKTIYLSVSISDKAKSKRSLSPSSTCVILSIMQVAKTSVLTRVESQGH